MCCAVLGSAGAQVRAAVDAARGRRPRGERGLDGLVRRHHEPLFVRRRQIRRPRPSRVYARPTARVHLVCVHIVLSVRVAYERVAAVPSPNASPRALSTSTACAHQPAPAPTRTRTPLVAHDRSIRRERRRPSTVHMCSLRAGLELELAENIYNRSKPGVCFVRVCYDFCTLYCTQ